MIAEYLMLYEKRKENFFSFFTNTAFPKITLTLGNNFVIFSFEFKIDNKRNYK